MKATKKTQRRIRLEGELAVAQILSRAEAIVFMTDNAPDAGKGVLPLICTIAEDIVREARDLWDGKYGEEEDMVPKEQAQ